MPLEGENQSHFNAASGYLTLGMYLEANEELDMIDPACRHFPEVLEAGSRIYEALERWELAEGVTARLVQIFPDDNWQIVLARLTKHLRGVEAALAILIEYQKKHPRDQVVLYRLAECECELGRPESALELLRQSFAIDDHLIFWLPENPALEAIWNHRPQK